MGDPPKLLHPILDDTDNPKRITMAGVKTYELRKQSKQQLEEKLAELKGELSKLRVAAAASNSVKSTKIGEVRKSIARVLTVINLTQRDQLREFYRGKRLPKDLRAKKTRAIRRRLTPNEAKAVTVRQRKQQIAFPQRKYALKA
uniref:ARAD1C29414p n=1 Tax=Blastobotrys adeninivorans TaxID=409370 RepID=A0A060T8K4_BLAAD